MIVQSHDTKSALNSLRELGIVHIEHQNELLGHHLAEYREEVNTLTKAIAILSHVRVETKQEKPADWMGLVHKILTRREEIDFLKENIARLQTQISIWEPWGDFDPRDFERLSQRGIHIRLCEMKETDKDSIPEEVFLEEISDAGKKIKCLVISRELIDLPFETITLPTQSLSELKRIRKEEQHKMEQEKKALTGDVKYLDSLKDILIEKQNVLSLEEAYRGAREDGHIAVIKGFCPEDACDALKEKAKKEHWGLLLEDVSEEDQVPTLLKNPRWVDMIKPVFKLIDIIPGYKEVDVSLVFLIFFTIFFGMLIGDAAYGTIFITTVFICHQKFKNKVADHSVFYLGYLLSGFNHSLGCVNGNLFRTELAACDD